MVLSDIRKEAAYLRKTLLLQVRDDTLTDKIRSFDNVKHLFIIVTEQGKLEAILGRIDGNRPGSSRAIQAMYSPAFNTGQIDRVIQSTDDASVAGESMHQSRRKAISWIHTPEASSI